MTDAKRKTLKLHKRHESGEVPLNEKPVELHIPDVGKTLNRHNADMVGEQGRRIVYPYDEGS